LTIALIVAIAAGVLILWYVFDWLFCFGTGIRKLYVLYPQVTSDLIQRHVFTFRGVLNVFLNRPMIRFGIGEQYLHVSFFLLPFLFRSPLSIPWNEVVIESPLEESWLPICRSAEFRLGSEWFFLRLYGPSARVIQAKIYEIHRPNP